MSEDICNIALRLRAAARRSPDKRAVVLPAGRDRAGRVTYSHLTFSQLEELSDSYARGLREYGIGRGVRTLVMVRPGLEFFALVFALFKTGAVPVLIDPGMGLERMLHCIRAAAPEAMVAIPPAHVVRLLRPGFFRTVRRFITVGRRWLWGGLDLQELAISGMPFEIADTAENELAAILFTTGSTGPAKGVEYEHGMFLRQCEIIERTYGIGPDDIDLPTFPLFALFSVGLGMTAVIPDMDPTRPAQVDPRRIVEAIRNQGCTFSFGSPALWGRVSEYCVRNGLRLPSLRKVLLAGAPVPPQTHENLLRRVLLEGAETHTPYGATESLPACDMRGSEVLRETAELTRQGRGFCVGRPVDGVEVEIIRLTEEPLANWDAGLVLPQGRVGEIAVKGRNVTKAYYNLPRQTELAKIKDGAEVWHRIGDLGYKDEKGRVWFCGRKAHRVEMAQGLMYSVCCEAIFNAHTQVRRSALVGLGERPAQTPAIIIELHEPKLPQSELARIRQELLALGGASELTRAIRTVFFHPSFPVDIRHNAKINREELARWAADQATAR